MSSHDRGEVWLVDLGYVAKVRPCLVISIPALAQNRALATLISNFSTPLTAFDRVFMQTIIKFLYWQEDGEFIGYLLKYPDYWTQGETMEDLKEHLRDLYNDITSEELPSIRKVGELVV